MYILSTPRDQGQSFLSNWLLKHKRLFKWTDLERVFLQRTNHADIHNTRVPITKVYMQESQCRRANKEE